MELSLHQSLIIDYTQVLLLATHIQIESQSPMSMSGLDIKSREAMRKLMKGRTGLQYNLDNLGLKIAKNVKNDGNCWFHSMVHLGYGASARVLRIGLANIMQAVGWKKGLFPNQPDVCLRDMFSVTNEIAHVYNVPGSSVTVYNYDTMCRDMRASGSWDRLPMNLIMQVVSLIYDVEFIVVPNRRRQTPLRVVWDDEHKFLNKVYLAKICEVHYMPLIEIPGWGGAVSDTSSSSSSDDDKDIHKTGAGDGDNDTVTISDFHEFKYEDECVMTSDGVMVPSGYSTAAFNKVDEVYEDVYENAVSCRYTASEFDEKYIHDRTKVLGDLYGDVECYIDESLLTDDGSDMPYPSDAPKSNIVN